jgi:hypothetical protein
MNAKVHPRNGTAVLLPELRTRQNANVKAKFVLTQMAPVATAVASREGAAAEWHRAVFPVLEWPSPLELRFPKCEHLEAVLKAELAASS